MGVLRAKVVALATLATVAMLAACAPAAEGGPATAAPPSAEASTGPSVTPSLDASESPRPTLRPRPTLSAEPLLTDDPAVAGDGDGDYYDDQPSGPSTWTYRWTRTDGYPTYYPEVLPPTNDDGTVGSGCNPPDSGTLPDGVWRALLVEHSHQEWPAWVEFDVVCSYSFQYPDAPEGLSDDWFTHGDWSYTLTNDDPTVFRLPVASDAIGRGWSGDWAPGAWDQTWLGCGPCDTWFWVNDGEVTELAWAYDWSTEWRNRQHVTG